jgi:peroxiredoxin Q/BCP
MVRFVLLAAVLLGSAAAFAPLPSTQTRVSSPLNLAVGETAPNFSLLDQNGKTVTRTSIKKPLVVFFYPADSSPGCTKQATSFNDQVKDLAKLGAQVVGISSQDVESKQKFATELGLSYSILADTDDAFRKAFAVPRAAFGLFPGRVTYVLDKKGVCTKVYNELGNAESHVTVAAEVLKEMKSPAKKVAALRK